MKRKLYLLFVIISYISCQRNAEHKELKSKDDISNAIDIAVNDILKDTTFAKEFGLYHYFSDRIKDSVLYRSLPYFKFLSKKDIEYIIYQQKKLKGHNIAEFTDKYNAHFKDGLTLNGRSVYFELGPPLFSLSGNFFLIHVVLAFKQGDKDKWDAVVVMCKKDKGSHYDIEYYTSPLKYKIPGYFSRDDRFPSLPGFP